MQITLRQAPENTLVTVFFKLNALSCMATAFETLHINGVSAYAWYYFIIPFSFNYFNISYAIFKIKRNVDSFLLCMQRIVISIYEAVR
jgi:hypothetical protein